MSLPPRGYHTQLDTTNKTAELYIRRDFFLALDNHDSLDTLLILILILLCYQAKPRHHTTLLACERTTGTQLSHCRGSNLCLQALQVNSDRLKQ